MSRRELINFFDKYGYEVSVYNQEVGEMDIYIHDTPKWYQFLKLFRFKKMLSFLKVVTPVGLTFNIYKCYEV